mmetsp:Transcript_3617/g.9700  ORF Transcript_3617/g.9700 Transcript_3617/m.9700 type:complete len:369 (-) Transcript_3617:102-1208(-)
MASSSSSSAPTEGSCPAVYPEGTRIILTLPDDLHHHFRDGPDRISAVVRHASERFGRCIAMPNLVPPVVDTEMALEYRERLLAAVPDGSNMEPLMTLYLTDNTTPEEVRKAYATGVIQACKYYPAGATTNSDAGVTDPKRVYPTLRAMAEMGMLLLIHSEVTGSDIDIFDREGRFIDDVMRPLVSDFPDLKIVMEHISTKDAVDYIMQAPDNVRATITCHHLLYNRNALLVGGIKPHYYCLPILKRESHRQALVSAVRSGSPKFFLGTDSAPHTTSSKQSGCGCAGVYTAHAAVELYAEAFELAGCLDNLDGFCGRHGAEHYGMERNERTITLEKREWTVPMTYEFGGETVTPLRAGDTVAWRIVDEE